MTLKVVLLVKRLIGIILMVFGDIILDLLTKKGIGKVVGMTQL